MPKPLDDIRVIANTRYVAGNTMAQMLADLGAEVIWIASKTRGIQNFYKKTILLNLKTEEGIRVFEDLTKVSDVILENARPGVMDRLGLSYEKMKNINPAIIYCSLTGFGQYGPDKDLPTYDPIIQARCGIMDITRGDGGEPCMVAGGAWMDRISSINSIVCVLAALHYRTRTGRGQRIDISMLESNVAIDSSARIDDYLSTGKYKTRSWRPGYGKLKCEDGEIVIAVFVRSPRIWERVCNLVDREDLILEAKKPDLTRDEMDMLQQKLGESLNNWASQKKREIVLEKLRAAQIPSDYVYTIPMVASDPHLHARGMFTQIYDHKAEKEVSVVNSPWHGMSETPASAEGKIIESTDRTEEVLTTILKYETNKIEKLKKDGILT